MNNIGIIGTETYHNQSEIIKIFQLIKRQFGPYVTILSGGNSTGVEHIAKKMALELNMSYKEFNPSYTGYKMYSAMDEQYYGKKYHMSHLSDRYKHLIYECDYLIIFIEKGNTLTFELSYAKKLAEKSNKKLLILN